MKRVRRFSPSLTSLEERVVLASNFNLQGALTAINTDFTAFAKSLQTAESAFANSTNHAKLTTDQSTLAKDEAFVVKTTPATASELFGPGKASPIDLKTINAAKSLTAQERTLLTDAVNAISTDQAALFKDAQTYFASVNAATNTLGNSLLKDLTAQGAPSDKLTTEIALLITGAPAPGSVSFLTSPAPGSLYQVLLGIGAPDTTRALNTATEAVQSALITFQNGAQDFSIAQGLPTPTPQSTATAVNDITTAYAAFAKSLQNAQAAYATSTAHSKLTADQATLSKDEAFVVKTTPATYSELFGPTKASPIDLATINAAKDLTAQERTLLTSAVNAISTDQSDLIKAAGTYISSINTAANTLGSTLLSQLTPLGVPQTQLIVDIDNLITGASAPGSVAFQTSASPGSLFSILSGIGVPSTTASLNRAFNAVQASLDTVLGGVLVF